MAPSSEVHCINLSVVIESLRFNPFRNTSLDPIISSNPLIPLISRPVTGLPGFANALPRRVTSLVLLGENDATSLCLARVSER